MKVSDGAQGWGACGGGNLHFADDGALGNDLTLARVCEPYGSAIYPQNVCAYVHPN